MKIKDVVHGEIIIENKLIINLIQTPEFQRMRKIKQLGLTNLIFPSAEHTRFAHSLGVYQIICKILKSLEQKNHYFEQDNKIALMIAGLLHDLGHGPLSHTAENFFNYSHEDYTIKIIQNKQGQIHRILTEYDKQHQSQILEEVIQFIQKTHPQKALNSLLSSSLDADRMDYLVRDSYYTGAVYGKIDLERIIDGFDYQEQKIVMSQKMIHTLEDFILSRYHMFVQVYLNQKSLYYEALLKQILKRIFLLYSQKYEFKNSINILLDLTEKEINIDQYININDYNFLSLIANLKNEDDQLLQTMINIFDNQSLFNEHKNFNLNITLKIEEQNKKVYQSNEPIYIYNEQTKAINLIQELSPIFAFAKNTLQIQIKQTELTI